MNNLEYKPFVNSYLIKNSKLDEINGIYTFNKTTNLNNHHTVIYRHNIYTLIISYKIYINNIYNLKLSLFAGNRVFYENDKIDFIDFFNGNTLKMYTHNIPGFMDINLDVEKLNIIKFTKMNNSIVFPINNNNKIIDLFSIIHYYKQKYEILQNEDLNSSNLEVEINKLNHMNNMTHILSEFKLKNLMDDFQNEKYSYNMDKVIDELKIVNLKKENKKLRKKLNDLKYILF
tara:strand:+ start:549 stop:1241 length:693 start_codon:yes stop_codon:yes gene_type:complete